MNLNILERKPANIKEILTSLNISFRKFKNVMKRYGVHISSPFDSISDSIMHALVEYCKFLLEINQPRIIANGGVKKRNSKAHPLSNYKHVYIRMINCPM